MAALRRMHHRHDDLPRAGDEVHRPAHAGNHFAGHHPVGEIAALVDFEAAEDGHVEVSVRG